MISYIIWDGSPELFSIGSFSLRWYGLLFALGFVVSQQILYRIFKKEGKPQNDVDILTMYMVVATLLGARLGHILFYQPEILWTDPLGVFLPFQFSPEFQFTGLQGLASHGGAFGILFALWLYSRKKKPGQNYIQTLDRIVIVVALTGAFIRLGNYFNSEIIGKPTDSTLGVVFVKRVTEALWNDPSRTAMLTSIQVSKNDDNSHNDLKTKKLMVMEFVFKKGISEQNVDQYMHSVADFYLSRMGRYVEKTSPDMLQYTLSTTEKGAIVAHANVLGIVRIPAQLLESFSSFLLFLFLLWIWSRKKGETPSGIIFGLFMIILWGLRFCYEFIKENQVPFENELPLNMGQILSLPLFITGIIILITSYKNAKRDRSLKKP